MYVTEPNTSNEDPLILYKYRPYNEYSEPMLRSKTLWAAKPSTLNDPFECQKTLHGLSLSVEKAQQTHWANVIFFKSMEIRHRVEKGESWNGIPNRGLKTLLDRLQSASSLEAAKEVLGIILAGPNGVSGLNEPTDFMALAEQTLREVGILSLSARPDVLLMWSHYADSHRGYCLGFERGTGTALGDSVRTSKVRYNSEIPEMNLDELLIQKAYYPVGSFGTPRFKTTLQLETESLRHVLFRKSPDWGYEEEWRHVVERGNEEINYPGPLREVILGLNMAKATRESLLSAISDDHEVVVRQMVINDTGALEIRDF